MSELIPKEAKLTISKLKPLDQNPAAIYLASLRPTGRASMHSSLDIMARLLTSNEDASCFSVDWSQLRFQHVEALRARLAEMYKPATVNKYLAALRGVLKCAWRLNLIDSETYHRAIDVKSMRNSTLPAGRDVADEEVRDLLQVCLLDKKKNTGARDAAIFAVAYSAGLRRAELASLSLKDWNSVDGSLTVTGGKGGKDRVVFINPDAQDLLEDWLVRRGSQPGALFPPINKSDRVSDRPMSTTALYYMVLRRLAEAGVDKLTPHDLRRTFVGNLLDNGVDIATVQKMAGHESVDTTARYDRRPARARREAAHTLSLPLPDVKKV
jgi:site-specific recombinase XerD